MLKFKFFRNLIRIKVFNIKKNELINIIFEIIQSLFLGKNFMIIIIKLIIIFVLIFFKKIILKFEFKKKKIKLSFNEKKL